MHSNIAAGDMAEARRLYAPKTTARPKDDRSDNCYSFFGRLGLIV